jgi:hypothetical protein
LSTEPNLTNRSKEDELLHLHKLGIRGIFVIHPFRVILKKPPFLISAGIFIVTIILLSTATTNTQELLGSIVGIGISIFPNLLGFSLGGFALIVGFGNQGALKSMVDNADHGSPSLYQTTTAIFAYSLLLQTATLILIGSVAFASHLNINPSFVNGNLVNILAISVMAFLYSWSLISVIYVVINIFTFAQCFHLYITINKEK